MLPDVLFNTCDLKYFFPTFHNSGAEQLVSCSEFGDMFEHIHAFLKQNYINHLFKLVFLNKTDKH